jgi:hypothetical protein
LWFGRSHNLNSRHCAGQYRTCEACVDILEDRVGTDGAAGDDIAPKSWQPLSARRGGTPIDETWQEGIPAWIDQAVRSWLSVMLIRTHERLFARLHFTGKFGDRERWRLVQSLNEADLLDWIDGALRVNADKHRELGLPDSSFLSDTEDLQTILAEGHSIWKVSDGLDGLERRQDETVTAAAHQASQAAESYGRAAAAERLKVRGARHTACILIRRKPSAKQSWPLRLWQFPPSPPRRLMLTWVMSTVNSGPKVICMS